MAPLPVAVRQGAATSGQREDGDRERLLGLMRAAVAAAEGEVQVRVAPSPLSPSSSAVQLRNNGTSELERFPNFGEHTTSFLNESGHQREHVAKQQLVSISVGLDGHLLLLFALLVLINLIVILGNILVIVAVYASAKLRNVTNIFIVSLATADLLLGVLVLPYALVYEVSISATRTSGRLHRLLCDIQPARHSGPFVLCVCVCATPSTGGTGPVGVIGPSGGRRSLATGRSLASTRLPTVSSPRTPSRTGRHLHLCFAPAGRARAPRGRTAISATQLAFTSSAAAPTPPTPPAPAGSPQAGRLRAQLAARKTNYICAPGLRLFATPDDNN